MTSSPAQIAFVHTAQVHVATFDALLAEVAPVLAARHVVLPELLEEAVREGGVGPLLEERFRRHLLEAAAGGARVVVCTCSTFGPCAERAAASTATPILRLDRPMAERAVELGQRIAVIACVQSTLASTTDLIETVARERDRRAELEVILLPDAWARFEAGDREGYLAAIAASLRGPAERADVIVLAQASMAGAAERCAGVRVPVLASPRLGVEAAVLAASRR